MNEVADYIRIRKSDFETFNLIILQQNVDISVLFLLHKIERKKINSCKELLMPTLLFYAIFHYTIFYICNCIIFVYNSLLLNK